MHASTPIELAYSRLVAACQSLVAARLQRPRLGVTLGSTRAGLFREAGDLLTGVGIQAIDNTFDSTDWRSRTAQAATDATVAPAYVVSLHLTPTTQRCAPTSGGGAAFRAQRRCRVCRTNRSTLVCSECRNPSMGGAMFLCGPKTGRDCFRFIRMLHTTPCFDNVWVGG